MKKLPFISYVKLTVGTLALFVTLPAFADDLAGSVVNLAVGDWRHQQSVFIGGQEVPQGRLGAVECLAEAESQLTVGQYLNKFVQDIGSDNMCTFSNFRDVGGDVMIDVTCSTAEGATIVMNLNYKYSDKSVSILGEGMMIAGGTSSAIRVMASSQYLGACS